MSGNTLSQNGISNRLAIHEAGHAGYLDLNGYTPEFLLYQPESINVVFEFDNSLHEKALRELEREFTFAGPGAEVALRGNYDPRIMVDDFDRLGWRPLHGVPVPEYIQWGIAKSVQILSGYKKGLYRISSGILDLRLDSGHETEAGIYIPIGHLF